MLMVLMKILQSTSYVHMLFALSHMLSTSVHTPSSSILNVENVHLQTPNMSNDDISQLVIKAQAMAWRPHSYLLICWGFFIINDGL
jgi:hypothetical protein